MNKTDNKKLYRHILTLAYPVVLSQIGYITVQLADTIMVSQLGALPLAAVSFAGNIFYPMFCIGLGMSMGLTPLIGERHAQGKHHRKARLFQNAMVLLMGVAAALVVVMLAGAPLLYYLGQPRDVVDVAIPYFQYMAWSMLPIMAMWVFKSYLEGIGNTKAAMWAITIGNAVNILLNWVFIYGHWGAPMMGAAGAGLATLISRIVMPLILVSYFFAKPSLRRIFKFFKWKNFQKNIIRRIFNVGAPITSHLLVECMAFAVTGIMVGWIGTKELAATQLAVMFANMGFMVVVGISAAGTIAVSHAYGLRNFSLVRDTARVVYRIGIVWNLFAAIMMTIFRYPLLRLFTPDTEVITLAAPLVICVALFQLSDGISANSAGILRGLQDVKYIMKATLFGYVIVCIPLSWIITFPLGAGTIGIWIGLIIGLTLSAILLFSRYRSTIVKSLRVRN